MIKQDKELEAKLVDELLKVNYKDNETTGAVINAICKLAAATGDRKWKEAAGKIADGALAESTLEDGESLKNFAYGKGLYSAYSLIEDGDRFREKAVQIAAQLDSQPRYDEGLFKGSDDAGERRMCRSYMYMPFYMTYETLDGGKERYNDIISHFRAFRSLLLDKTVAELGRDESAYNILAHYCAALIDTMESMDQMLYEIYHEMLDYYREAVKAVIASGAVKEEGIRADYVFGYAVLKGCRMKALLTEKYEDKVTGLMSTISDPTSSMYTNAFKTMYYSEAIRNREYQDYGRGKGGVLWS